MAKFCTKCGKPLVDGQPCSCTLQGKVEPEEEKKMYVTEETEAPKEKKVVKKAVRKRVVKKTMNIWEMFVAVLKAPVTAMEQVVNEKYFMNGMLLALIECALMAFSVCAVISSMIRMTYNGVSSIANSISGGYSMGRSYAQYVNVPYFEIFFKLLIFYIIIKFLFVVISMGMLNGLGKAKISFKAAFPAASAYSTGMIVGLVVSIVLTFLNPFIGLIFLMLTSYLALIMYTASITGIKEIKRNNCGWIVFLTMVINGLITMILLIFVAQSFVTQLQNSIYNSFGSLF